MMGSGNNRLRAVVMVAISGLLASEAVAQRLSMHELAIEAEAAKAKGAAEEARYNQARSKFLKRQRQIVDDLLIGETTRLEQEVAAGLTCADDKGGNILAALLCGGTPALISDFIGTETECQVDESQACKCLDEEANPALLDPLRRIGWPPKLSSKERELLVRYRQPQLACRASGPLLAEAVIAGNRPLARELAKDANHEVVWRSHGRVQDDASRADLKFFESITGPHEYPKEGDDLELEDLAQQAAFGRPDAWAEIDRNFSCNASFDHDILENAVCQGRTATLARLLARGGRCKVDLDPWKCVARRKNPTLARQVAQMRGQPTKDQVDLYLQHGAYDLFERPPELGVARSLMAGRPDLARAMMRQGLLDEREILNVFYEIFEEGSVRGFQAAVETLGLPSRVNFAKAIENGHLELVKVLLERGHFTDHDLQVGFEAGPEMFQLLVSAGRRPSAATVREIIAQGGGASLVGLMPLDALVREMLRVNRADPLDSLRPAIDRELADRGLAVQGGVAWRLLALGLDEPQFRFQLRGGDFDAFALDSGGKDGLTRALLGKNEWLTELYARAAAGKKAPPQLLGRSWLHMAAANGDFRTLIRLRQGGHRDSADQSGRLPVDEFWHEGKDTDFQELIHARIPYYGAEPDVMECTAIENTRTIDCFSRAKKDRVPYFRWQISFEEMRGPLSILAPFGLGDLHSKPSQVYNEQDDLVHGEVIGTAGRYRLKVTGFAIKGLQPELERALTLCYEGAGPPPVAPGVTLLAWLGVAALAVVVVRRLR